MFKKIRQHKDFKFYLTLAVDSFGFVSFLVMLFVAVCIMEVMHNGGY